MRKKKSESLRLAKVVREGTISLEERGAHIKKELSREKGQKDSGQYLVAGNS